MKSEDAGKAYSTKQINKQNPQRVKLQYFLEKKTNNLVKIDVKINIIYHYLFTSYIQSIYAQDCRK